MPAKGIFVTGTDTGVGKTVIAALLCASLRKRGIAVAAMKPAETGCAPHPLDALTLRAAAESDDPIDLVCPYRFTLPVAPEAAAVAEGNAIESEVLRSVFKQLSQGGRFVVVEGAGGAGTPYGPGLLGMQIAAVLGIPALIVSQATLGTVGKTLVTLNAMRGAGVACAGVILNRIPGLPSGPDDATNAPLIQAHAGGVPVLGTMPAVPPPPSPLPDGLAVRRWAAQNAPSFECAVDLGRLVAELSVC